MSLDDEIRDHVERFYLTNTSQGVELLTIANKVEDHDRQLLGAFLERLEQTGALSVPASDLTAAVDETLEQGERDEG